MQNLQTSNQATLYIISIPPSNPVTQQSSRSRGKVTSASSPSSEKRTIASKICTQERQKLFIQRTSVSKRKTMSGTGRIHLSDAPSKLPSAQRKPLNVNNPSEQPDFPLVISFGIQTSLRIRMTIVVVKQKQTQIVMPRDWKVKTHVRTLKPLQQ